MTFVFLPSHDNDGALIMQIMVNKPCEGAKVLGVHITYYLIIALNVMVT